MLTIAINGFIVATDDTYRETAMGQAEAMLVALEITELGANNDGELAPLAVACLEALSAQWPDHLESALCEIRGAA